MPRGKGDRFLRSRRWLPRRGTRAILLDDKTTDGRLMIGRFDVSEGEALPYHNHTREDEVIKGTALL